MDNNFDQLNQNKKYIILREFETQCEKSIFKISVSYENRKNQRGILLELFNTSDNLVTDNFIKFEKLKSLASKILISNTIPNLSDLESISNLDSFIEKNFIYHIFINKNGDGLSLGVLSRPLGVCNSFYEIYFLKNKCTVDILVLPTKEIRFFIYSIVNETQYLSFDLELDESSYKLVFLEITSKKLLTNNEIMIPSYKLVNDKHMGKNGFIQYVILKIQNIVKDKLNDPNATFEGVIKLLKDTNMKITVSNELNFFNLWIIVNEDLNNFSLEFYSLNKILCMIY